jgi:hypothetical protein
MAQWRWPLLVRAVRVGLRPAAIGFGLAMIASLTLVEALASIGREGPGPLGMLASAVGVRLERIIDGSLSLDGVRIASGIAQLAATPSEWFQANTWRAIALVPSAMIVGLFGGAICRLAALDLGRRTKIEWPQALGVAANQWRSMAAVVLGPIAIVGGLILLLALGGAAMVGLPYVNVVGALGYGLLLLVGLVCVVSAVVYVLGAPLLVPAVACEGTDAVDSLGRVFPYVVGQPIRLLAYLAVVIATVTIVGSAATWGAGAVIGVTASTAGAWAGPTAREAIVAALTGAALPEGASANTGSWTVAGPVVGFWNRLLLAAAGGVGVAMFFACSTALYLLMRHAVDGQDPEEIWVPGEIEASMQRTQDVRRQLNPTASAPPVLPAEAD